MNFNIIVNVIVYIINIYNIIVLLNY